MISKIFDALAARLSLVILGLLVVIFGLISPTRTMVALRQSVFKDHASSLFCKDC